jgi:hypothetical protein
MSSIKPDKSQETILMPVGIHNMDKTLSSLLMNPMAHVQLLFY